MRKVWLLAVVVFTLIVGLQAVAAQDATALTLGEPVQGTISADHLSDTYTFTGSKGQLIGIGALPILGEDDQVDSTLALKNPKGDLIASNDDISYPSAAIITFLPADGEYTVEVSRSGGADGSSVGNYTLVVSEVTPKAKGEEVQTSISGEYGTSYPSLYVYVPEEDGPATFTFSQDLTDIYASIRVVSAPDWDSYPEGGYYDSVLDLYSTGYLSSVTATANLKGGHVYVVVVSWGGYTPGSSYSSDATSNISIKID